MEAENIPGKSRNLPSVREIIDTEDHGARPGQIHTVQSLANYEPAFNEGGIRWTIFQHKNRLLEAGAIFYSGKKLLIDRDRYITCVKEGL
jgi:hypothetical protein